MTELVAYLALAGVALGLWLVAGVFNEIRDSIAERVAAWALPAGQPVTVRVGQALARVARWLTPRREVRFIPTEFDDNERWRDLFECVFAWPCDRQAPAAALAEIEADLAAEERVIAPIGLTFPLLWLAVWGRLLNGASYGAGAAWCVLLALCVPVSLAVATLRMLVATVSRILPRAGARRRPSAAVVFGDDLRGIAATMAGLVLVALLLPVLMAWLVWRGLRRVADRPGLGS